MAEKKIGRPSSFKQEVADELCARIADGYSLRTICSQDAEMPVERTVYRWLAANEAFRQQYAHARELQADAIFDECLHIADSHHENAEQLNHSKLRIDTRKWMAGKLRPKKYGDKLSLTDGDGGPLIPALHVTISRTESSSSS